MDGMKERQDAFEKKYALDEELRFKADAQRNRMIGLWAADHLGKSGSEAEEYAKEIVKLAFLHGREDDVVEKILHDFNNANKSIDEKELRQTMANLLKESLAHLGAINK